MPVIILVISVLAIIVGGGLAREYLKTRKEHYLLFRVDMNELKDRMDQIETDMAEQKELIADTIIKHA